MPYPDAGRTWRHPPVPFRSEDGRLPKHLNWCNAPGFTIAGADGTTLQYTVNCSHTRREALTAWHSLCPQAQLYVGKGYGTGGRPKHVSASGNHDLGMPQAVRPAKNVNKNCASCATSADSSSEHVLTQSLPCLLLPATSIVQIDPLFPRYMASFGPIMSQQMQCRLQ